MAPSIQWTTVAIVAHHATHKTTWARMSGKQIPHVFSLPDGESTFVAFLVSLLRSVQAGKTVLVAGQGTAVTMKAALQQYDTSEHTNERPHYGKRMPAHMEKVGRHDAPQPWLPS